jgi:hypothetical protein
MNPYTRVEIIDRAGWRKESRLQKSIIYVGNDSRNDVVLDREGSRGVAARHAQLLSLPEGYRLINLGDTDILLGSSGEESLAPHTSVDIASGEQVRIGDFTLIFGGSKSISNRTADTSTSEAIGLSLFLSQTELAPNCQLDGSVTVCNLGDKPGVQFKVEVEGLESNCYEIGPGPILYPNAEKEVFFCLHHPKGPKPVTGEHRINIRATAPEAYPGQSVVVSQVLNILPFYSHKLRLVVPD